MQAWKWIATALATLAPMAAHAENFNKNVFGHDVVIKDGGAFDNTLFVDGKELLQSELMSVDKISTIENTGVIIGNSGMAGNACPGSIFLIAIAPRKAPEFVGTFGDCQEVEAHVEADKVVIDVSADVGESAETWVWSPAKGLTHSSHVVAFDQGVGWDSLRRHKHKFPADLLESKEISAQMMQQVGPDNADFYRQALKMGFGELEWQGHYAMGGGCISGRCDEEGQLTVFDLDNKTLFIALKQYESKIQVFPDVHQWPKTARLALKKWAETWP